MIMIIYLAAGRWKRGCPLQSVACIDLDHLTMSIKFLIFSISVINSLNYCRLSSRCVICSFWFLSLVIIFSCKKHSLYKFTELFDVAMENLHWRSEIFLSATKS